MFIASEMPSSHLIFWCSLLSFCPQSFPASGTFSNESSVHIRWPKYWNFSFSISPSSEYSGLIFLKIDWFDLLAVQRTFRSLLQLHNSKASILWCSGFFTVQLSHPYMIPPPAKVKLRYEDPVSLVLKLSCVLQSPGKFFRTLMSPSHIQTFWDHNFKSPQVISNIQQSLGTVGPP